MLENVLKTYKFYDKKGRRLAIFGQYDQGWLLITVIPCSVKDQFRKETAKDMFTKADESGKEFFQIPVEKGQSVKGTLLKWCNQNYQKPIAFWQRFTLLGVKNGKKTRILQKQRVNKMDMYNIH